METEAKFIVPGEAAFSRLRRVTQFGPFERTNEKTKTVHDRYVDTPDHRFYKNELYVRLREGKDGDILLTLKRLGAPPQGAVHSRDEYQTSVPGLERINWPESDVTSMVEEIAGDQPLVDLVSVDQTRTVSNLLQGERRVAELSLDEVTIQTTHGPVTTYELEAELLQEGLTSDLSTLVQLFTDEYGFEPQPLTKFERAIRLAEAEEPAEDEKTAAGAANGRKAKRAETQSLVEVAPDDADLPLLESGLPEPVTHVNGAGDVGAPTLKLAGEPAVTQTSVSQTESKQVSSGQQPEATPTGRREMGLKQTDSIDTASRKIVLAYLEDMLANEQGTIKGEDPEALHDMRVATRRMRAALRVLAPYLQNGDPTRVRRGLRAIAQSLGAVRDMDVLIQNALKFRGSLPEEQRSGLDGLVESWQSQRDKGRKRLIRLLESKDYNSFKRRVDKFVNDYPKREYEPVVGTDIQPYQVRHVAPTAILTRYEAVRSFEAITDAPPPKQKARTPKKVAAQTAQAGGNAQLEASLTAPPSGNSQWQMPPTVEQLHALRISGKYLRYTLECFRETLPPDAAVLIQDVTKMQDQLGNMHDADVAAGLINDFIDRQSKRRKKSKRAYEVPPALAAYLAEREAAVRLIHADFFSTWARLQSPEWRARLATVIMA